MKMILYRFTVRRYDYHADFNMLYEKLLTDSERAAATGRFRRKFEQVYPNIIGTEMVLTVKDAEYEATESELTEMESTRNTLLDPKP